ncbi:MAG TPA: hypothetical protein VMY42_10485 [Thermoguttaceae bacterium]|nr:hypothetical protein [Thermoguttaceae bacterium]
MVVSKETSDDPQWNAVVEALVRKYAAEVLVYEGDVANSMEPLKKAFPRYACFVASPEEATREFVVAVHRLTRKLDDDPYTDVVWGILTGYSPQDAMRIVAADKPLVIRKAAAGTGINLDLFDEGVWYSEGQQGVYHEKKPGGKPEKKQGPDDSTKALVDVFNDYRPDLFLTSGHATDRDWQIGYSYRNGQFRCKDGVLLGIDTAGRGYLIRSPNPKVYLPVGNCLMGRIRDRQSMALAWMGSGGVNQMIGYVVSTWYGKGGWGTRDYLFSEPGRYTLSEAFYFNNQTIVHQLETRFPKTARAEFDRWNIETDPRLIGKLTASLGYRSFDNDVKDNVGLLWDRDTVAFYGDPAWEARLTPRELPFDQRLSIEAGVYTFQIDVREDGTPGRQPAMLLPHRVKEVEIVEGREFAPLITDNFIMLMEPGKFEKGKTYRVVFRAERMLQSAPIGRP